MNSYRAIQSSLHSCGRTRCFYVKVTHFALLVFVWKTLRCEWKSHNKTTHITFFDDLFYFCEGGQRWIKPSWQSLAAFETWWSSMIHTLEEYYLNQCCRIPKINICIYVIVYTYVIWFYKRIDLQLHMGI